jgi:Spondin_N
MKLLVLGTTLVSALVLMAAGPRAFAQSSSLVTYRVTLANMTNSQPLSPPVAATHEAGIHMFEVGQMASEGIRAIAEDGEPTPMFQALSAAKQVTEAVNIGQPLARKGTTAGNFTDSVTFLIHARPGDRFSIATMLICTNDGFTGLDSVELPQQGAQTFMLNSYDAGTENNTEKSKDIVDPCSALGPEKLPGDPDGNVDTDPAVDTTPAQVIQSHPGIRGVGDLKPAVHGWKDPVAMVTIERMN